MKAHSHISVPRSSSVQCNFFSINWHFRTPLPLIYTLLIVYRRILCISGLFCNITGLGKLVHSFSTFANSPIESFSTMHYTPMNSCSVVHMLLSIFTLKLCEFYPLKRFCKSLIMPKTKLHGICIAATDVIDIVLKSADRSRHWNVQTDLKVLPSSGTFWSTDWISKPLITKARPKTTTAADHIARVPMFHLS